MPAQFLSGAVLSIDLYVTKDFFKGNPYRFVTVLSNDMTGLEKKRHRFLLFMFEKGKFVRLGSELDKEKSNILV